MQSPSSHGAFWSARRAFVFGGTGFLGHHLVRELADAGAIVGGLAHTTRPDPALVTPSDYRNFVRGSAADRDRSIRALAAFEPDVVFHLTTATGRLDEAVFAACRVAAPSAPVVVPVDAASPFRTVTIRRYATQFNRRAAVGVLPVLYGEGDRRDAGWVARTVRESLAGGRVTPPPAADLGRECLYAGDAARGLVRLGELALDLATPNGQAVALSHRPTVTLADVIGELVTLPTTPRLRHESADEADGHLSDRTDWRPTVSISESVRRTVEWVESHGLVALSTTPQSAAA